MNKTEIMMKAINNFKFDEVQARYTMALSEVQALHQLNNKYDIMDKSFTYGFIKGMRYMKAHQKKVGALNE